VTPLAELLLARPVALAIDLKALISRPGVRVQCDSCGEEIINQREVVRDGAALCRACAEAGYIQAGAPATASPSSAASPPASQRS
jgi:formylmethanofuran dehydrogenase subunit E